MTDKTPAAPATSGWAKAPPAPSIAGSEEPELDIKRTPPVGKASRMYSLDEARAVIAAEAAPATIATFDEWWAERVWIIGVQHVDQSHAMDARAAWDAALRSRAMPTREQIVRAIDDGQEQYMTSVPLRRKERRLAEYVADAVRALLEGTK